jgi:hypothetical protein
MSLDFIGCIEHIAKEISKEFNLEYSLSLVAVSKLSGESIFSHIYNHDDNIPRIDNSIENVKKCFGVDLEVHAISNYIDSILSSPPFPIEKEYLQGAHAFFDCVDSIDDDVTPGLHNLIYQSLFHIAVRSYSLKPLDRYGNLQGCYLIATDQNIQCRLITGFDVVQEIKPKQMLALVDRLFTHYDILKYQSLLILQTVSSPGLFEEAASTGNYLLFDTKNRFIISRSLLNARGIMVERIDRKEISQQRLISFLEEK